MRAVMALAQHVIVLHQGEVIARRRAGEIVREPAVLECYLGEERGYERIARSQRSRSLLW